MKKADVIILKRALLAFKPYRMKMLLLAVCICAGTLLGLVNSILIWHIFDDALKNNNLTKLGIYCTLMFIAPLLSNVLVAIQAFINNSVGQGVMQSFRGKLFDHLQRVPIEFFVATQAGEIHSRFNNDLAGLRTLVTTTATTIAGSFLALVSTVVAMIYISPVLALVSVLMLPAIVLNAFWAGGLRRLLSREKQETLARISVLIQESLGVSGALLTKVFGRQETIRGEFELQNRRLADIEFRQQKAWTTGYLAFGAFYVAIPALTLFIGGWQMVTGLPLLGERITVGALMAFTALQARLFTPAGQLLNVEGEIQGALILFERLFEYFDLPVDVVDAEQALNLNQDQVKGDLNFSNVNFSYKTSKSNGTNGSGGNGNHASEGGQRHLLNNISFRAHRGDVIALVGTSGSGKSTIAHLIPRLYDVTSGVITIDGYDIRSITLRSLRSLIGIVTQDTFLLHSSVRENLLVANPSATDEQLREAAKAAAIHDRILALPEGYSTVVGEHGYKLSGGEKQRIAIARVILKNPRILILDEATSSLDADSEGAVQRAMTELMKDRTTLIIAHRMSAIKEAQLILVLNDGEVAEKGSHAELMARQGKYYNLYKMHAVPV